MVARRILLVSSGSGSRGGGEIFLVYLARGLTARGHEVIAWIPSHRRMDELATKCAQHARVIRSDYQNTYEYRLRSVSTYFNGSISRSIAANWAALGPDVIHVNKQNLEDGLDLLEAARASGLPTVSTIHLTQSASYLGAFGAPLRDWIARRALRAFDRPLIAVLEARRSDLAAFIGTPQRTFTVLNGVPLPDPSKTSDLRQTQRKALGVRQDQLLIAAVGRLVAQKQPFRFLEVARALNGSLPHTRFIWVGDGDLCSQWRQYVSDNAMTSYVSCIGWKDNVVDILSAADVFLHLSKFEGLPLALVEAMALGLPCALSRELASDLRMMDQNTCLLVDDLDELKVALQDRRSLDRVGANAKNMVWSSLSDEAMASCYERIYAEEIQRTSC